MSANDSGCSVRAQRFFRRMRGNSLSAGGVKGRNGGEGLVSRVAADQHRSKGRYRGLRSFHAGSCEFHAGETIRSRADGRERNTHQAIGCRSRFLQISRRAAHSREEVAWRDTCGHQRLPCGISGHKCPDSPEPRLPFFHVIEEVQRFASSLAVP
jgi:hypothetical protein